MIVIKNTGGWHWELFLGRHWAGCGHRFDTADAALANAWYTFGGDVPALVYL